MIALWYATRASGQVALLFLTTVVALGALSAARAGGRRVPRFVLAGLHRNLTLVGLGFIALHVATTLLDTYVSIPVGAAVVPFTSDYRPAGIGAGAIAFDLLLVLTATSLLRDRVGARLWRWLHWSAYGCWAAAVVHTVGTGTDVRTPVFLALAGAGLAVVLPAVAWRLAVAGPGHRGRRLAIVLTGGLLLGAVGGWTAQGAPGGSASGAVSGPDTPAPASPEGKDD